MYPTDFSLTHALLSEHLDALRREAAQVRDVTRQTGNSRLSSLFVRLRRALTRSRHPLPTEGEVGAAQR